MRPSELCRLLNSTPLGEVLTPRQLNRHRMRAGFRVGDARGVDLLRYVAWLVQMRFQHKQPTKREQDAYGQVKERARARAAAIAESGRDIGELPKVKNARRKRRAAKDFRYFCESYFPEIFYLGWSEDHLKVIAKIEEAVLRGGLFAMAMPRGSGKTALAVCACVWAVLYGHHHFVLLIGSSEKTALNLLESIKVDLRMNDRLNEDFPEVCFPIRKLGKITNRAAGQLYEGKPTEISWTGHEIVLPAIPASPAAGNIIRTAGLTGEIRGAQFKRPDGKLVRPTLVVPDDPQTDESARSPSQCASRESILAGAVLGLAGPGQQISGIMPCTVIKQGDMADNLLDRAKHPQWNGERTKMVYAWPTNKELWDEYRKVRDENFRNGGRGEPATALYRQKRKAMDAGAVIAWPARKNADEISAVQHAMNLRFRDERAFFAEYQNEPLSDDPTAIELTADQIAAKINRHARGVVPHGTTRVTMFVDVQGKLLYYVVAGYAEEFGGHVLDYGAYPDQGEPYFTAANPPRPLAQLHAGGLEAQLFAGLDALFDQLCPLEWRTDDGAVHKIERSLVDANWGKSSDVVYQWCRQSKWAAIAMPSHGKFFGASSQPMHEYKRRPGDRIGHYWRVPNVVGRRQVRHAVFDTNYWKSFVMQRLAEPLGAPGCLDLFGERPETHRMFADHLTAEYSVPTTARGRTIDEWKQRLNRDNHWLDCLVGTAVAASMQGATLPGTQGQRPPQRERMTVAELRARKRGGA